MPERRKHDRSRSFSACTVAGGPQRAALHGVVRDFSAGGARLLLDEPRRAPVDLEVAMRDGVRQARVVWRSEVAVGVAFTTAAVVSLDAARRARLGDEARLAGRIARFVRPSLPAAPTEPAAGVPSRPDPDGPAKGRTPRAIRVSPDGAP